MSNNWSFYEILTKSHAENKQSAHNIKVRNVSLKSKIEYETMKMNFGNGNTNEKNMKIGIVLQSFNRKEHENIWSNK